MQAIESLLYKSVKLSCIDEEALTKRRANLQDTLDLFYSMRDNFRSQQKYKDIIDATGVTIIAISLVSDVIRDTVGEVVGSKNVLMKIGLQHIYDKARDKKWAGNKYENVIKGIEKNTGYVEKALKEVGGDNPNVKMIRMFITVHKSMAMNVTGLIGAMEDAAEAKAVLNRSLATLERDIKRMVEEAKGLDHYLATGEGAAKSGERMSRIQNTRGLP